MKHSSSIHLISAKRSPIGRLGGSLQSLNAVELALQVATHVVPEKLRALVDTVILGQGLQAGAGMNAARQVGLKLNLPERTSAFTVNMVCGSGMKAVELGVQEIQNESSDLVLVGGTESMSQAPYYLPHQRWGKRWSHATCLDAALYDGLTDPVFQLAMGETAENIADQFKISRNEQDEYAWMSQQKTAQSLGAFKREIVPIQIDKKICEQDEHPRPTTTLEQLSKLSPVFRRGGTVTAGNASGVNDGAAMLLMASDKICQQHQLSSRAQWIGTVTVGCHPKTMGMGPVGAIQKLCQKIGWSMKDVDLFEINEAFAAQTLGCLRELPIPKDRINVRGGAIALGHPIGCSGARILVTLLHAMEDMDKKRGIAALCIGGGMGIATAIERK